MPITYSIDHDRRVIFETWTGDVTAADLGEYWKQYLADPDVMAIRRTLVDLRQCRILFKGADLVHLIESVAKPRLAGRTWKTAIVTDRPLQFGISRQYQVFAESYSKDAIFQNPEAALAWLLADEQPHQDR
jgi:hypothetical protein